MVIAKSRSSALAFALILLVAMSVCTSALRLSMLQHRIAQPMNLQALQVSNVPAINSNLDYGTKSSLFVSKTQTGPIAYRFMQKIKKILASVLVVLSQSNILNKLAAALPVSAGVISLVPNVAVATPWSKYSQLKATEKLATTPVFFLANSQGSPYLQEDVQTGKSDQRIVTYFMSSDDASEYLNEMSQGSPQNVNEFRVMTTSLEKIIGKIQSKKQSRKLGRYEVSMIYRLQPSTRQCANAEKLLSTKSKSGKFSSATQKGDMFPSLKEIFIPMFSAKGMIITRSNGEVVR